MKTLLIRALTISALAFVVPCNAFAQDDAAREAERLRQIELQMEENRRAAEALRLRQEETARAAEALRTRLIEIADGLQDAEAEASAIETELERLENEEQAAGEKLERMKRATSDVLAALQSLERSRPPALVVAPDDATRAAIAAIALAGVTPELSAQIEDLNAQLALIDRLRTRQAKRREDLNRTEAELAERQRLLAEALEQRETAEAEDQARLRRIEREDARLAAEATTLRDLIARLREGAATPAPRAGVEALPAGPRIYARLPRLFTEARSILPWPAAGRLVSNFGANQAGGGRSEDVAISTRPGAVVTAPFGGEIAFADEFGPLGNVVILDVGENYSLVLIGVSRMDIRRGERVRPGEPLGQMARREPGLLRFQVRRGNSPVNPMLWLQQPTAAAP